MSTTTLDKAYTVEKTTVECYKLRHKSGMYWADITIDSKLKGGRIQIASDYGSWQNYWGATCDNFKEFLISLDIHYAAGKFNADRYFDIEKTLLSYIKLAEENKFKFNKMLELKKEIHQLENYTHKEEFSINVFSCKTIMSMYEGCPEICYDIDPGFKNFWANCWPVLIDELKKEIQPNTYLPHCLIN